MIQRSVLITIGVLVLAGSAAAFPPYLAAWQDKYPTSTIDERMATLTGASCNTCHHPPSRSDQGNCYREDLKILLQSMTIFEALDQLDGMDSDGDGVPNGVEITEPRFGEPGEIGYSMGLVGPTGTDPCGVNPAEIVSGQSETPITEIPAVSQWGVVVLTLLLLTVGKLYASRQAPAGLTA